MRNLNNNNQRQQFIIVDLAEYFNTMTVEERLLWNDDIGDNIGSLFKIESQTIGAATGDTKHVYNDGGVTETQAINLLKEVTPIKSDGTDATKAIEIAKLKITFYNDYALKNQSTTYSKLTEGEYTTLIKVKYTPRGETAEKETILTAPFTIAAPTEAEITSLFTFDPQYYANGVLTIVAESKNGTVNLNRYITALNPNYEGIKLEGNDKAKVDENTKYQINYTDAGEWTVSGIKFTVLGKKYDAPSFKLKVAVAQPYSVDFTKASPVVTSGMTEEPIIIEYYKPTGNAQTDAPHTNYYNIKSATGAVQDDDVVTEIEFEYNSNLIEVSKTNLDGDLVLDNIKITPKDVKVTVDTTVKVKATFTMRNGNTVDYEFNVTVKAYPM